MTARDRRDSRRSGVNERAAITRPEIQALIDWHEGRSESRRLKAGRAADPISRATFLGNAGTHQVAASVLRGVLAGKGPR